MSKLAFDKIKAALEEVKAYLEGSRDKSGSNPHAKREEVAAGQATSDSFGNSATTERSRPPAFAA
jgi:hypothetical protein